MGNQKFNFSHSDWDVVIGDDDFSKKDMQNILDKNFEKIVNR